MNSSLFQTRNSNKQTSAFLVRKSSNPSWGSAADVIIVANVAGLSAINADKTTKSCLKAIKRTTPFATSATLTSLTSSLPLFLTRLKTSNNLRIICFSSAISLLRQKSRCIERRRRTCNPKFSVKERNSALCS